MFLFLEDGNIVILENVVALVRQEGGTRVVLSDGRERRSSFTPLVIDRRSRNFCLLKRLNGGNLRHD